MMYDHRVNRLKNRTTILKIKRIVIQKEIDFVEMQIAVECFGCRGLGEVAPAVSEVKLFPYVDKHNIHECEICNGHGHICSYCHNGLDLCECGDIVDKNWKDYDHYSKYYQFKFLMEKGA